MKHRVILDTNAIYNDNSSDSFLGRREDLGKFVKVADLYIPDIVLDELMACKRRHLEGEVKTKFIENIYSKLFGIEKTKVEGFDIEEFLLQLKSKETIPYSVIKLTETAEILREIRNLAIAKKQPFENKEGTDKGFKDAYIYLTIKEFLSKSGDMVFVVTRDGLLGETLAKLSRIKVVHNYGEFEKYIDEYLREPYFISRLKEEVDEEIEEDDIEDTWLNLEENWVLKIICNSKVYFVEVDFTSKEIVGSVNVDFSASISKLVASGSFTTTRESVDELKDYVNFFSDQDIQTLFKAAIENNQIYSIASYEDVKEFFTGLYQNKSQTLSDDIKDLFKHYFEIK